MGSKLCIVDIDTRALDEPGELLSSEGLDWGRLHYTSAGMLNHYIYGMYDLETCCIPDTRC
jgi:hypothetical protein